MAEDQICNDAALAVALLLKFLNLFCLKLKPKLKLLRSTDLTGSSLLSKLFDIVQRFVAGPRNIDLGAKLFNTRANLMPSITAADKLRVI